MLKVGEIVRISYSRELERMGMRELVRRKATVTLIVNNKYGKCRGAYVIPRSGKFKNEEWFIPIQSIENEDSIDAIRTMELLKHAVL